MRKIDSITNEICKGSNNGATEAGKIIVYLYRYQTRYHRTRKLIAPVTYKNYNAYLPHLRITKIIQRSR